MSIINHLHVDGGGRSQERTTLSVIFPLTGKNTGNSLDFGRVASAENASILLHYGDLRDSNPQSRLERTGELKIMYQGNAFPDTGIETRQYTAGKSISISCVESHIVGTEQPIEWQEDVYVSFLPRESCVKSTSPSRPRPDCYRARRFGIGLGLVAGV